MMTLPIPTGKTTDECALFTVKGLDVQGHRRSDVVEDRNASTSYTCPASKLMSARDYTIALQIC